MKKLVTINSKEIAKRIEKSMYYDIESFNESAKRWCKAIKEGRIIATVTSVARSGMSRNIKIVELHKHGVTGTNRYYTLNFNQFLSVLGYRVNDRGEVIMHGCGMDMVYAITEGVVSELHYLGAINEKEYNELRRNTANVI